MKRSRKYGVYLAMRGASMLCALFLAATNLLAGESKHASPGVKALPDPTGIHNLFLLGANVYSGGTPEGEIGFKELAKLGIKTVISVDGARPDIDTANKFGMRYVHLPHGYDGINAHLQLTLAKAGDALAKPIYVHCHHGTHRGPAAAAIICMSKDGWTSAQAEDWLKTAGTSTNYAGLYATVRHFKKPSAEALKALRSDFPEVAEVSGLVEAMVEIDARWENLKAIRSVEYSAPKDHPDILPANEALILLEHFREAQRLRESLNHGADFVELLQAAQLDIQQAEQLLRYDVTKLEVRALLDQRFNAISRSCSGCHQRYRNQ